MKSIMSVLCLWLISGLNLAALFSAWRVWVARPRRWPMPPIVSRRRGWTDRWLVRDFSAPLNRYCSPGPGHTNICPNAISTADRSIRSLTSTLKVIMKYNSSCTCLVFC